MIKQKKKLRQTIFLMMLTGLFSSCAAVSDLTGLTLSPVMLIGGSVIGVCVIAALILLPYLEKKIPILKALNLTRYLRSIPVIGAYYQQARSINQQVARGKQQTKRVTEEKKRLQKAWGRTTEQYGNGNGDQAVPLVHNGVSTGATGGAANGSVSMRVPQEQVERADETAEGTTNNRWLPRRKVAREQKSSNKPRFAKLRSGFKPKQTGNNLLLWPGFTPADTTGGPNGNGFDPSELAFSPPIGRIPVPPEFDVDLEDHSIVRESELLGRRIERYQVDSMLHDGEVSDVYQTYDMKIGRIVALKILSFPEYLTRPAKDNILEDIRTLSSADHPNLTHIYDFGEDQGRLFVVSQFVKGMSIDSHLAHMMQNGEPVQLSSVLMAVSQVAAALKQVHDLGLVHGLLKPSHILIEPSHHGDENFQAHLLDVGLLNLYRSVDEIPPSFWPFVSPEYCQNGRVDGRSDVYSLGAVLYYLTVGQVPFNPVSAEQATELHTKTTVSLPTDVSATLPAVVEQVILKAMATHPEDRYQSAQEMMGELHKAATPINGRYEDRKFLKEGERVLHIESKGQSRRLELIDQPIIHIGSGPENDVVLTGVNVARSHLRLEQQDANLIIYNLSNEGATYLQGTRMLPDLAEVWEGGNVVQIGPYLLDWEEIQESRAITNPLLDEMIDKLAGVALQPATIELAPGEFGDVQINLFNQASHVDQYELQIDNLPAEWIQLSTNNLSLMPGDQARSVLNIKIPDDFNINPGDYPFNIKVIPAAYPDQVITTHSNLKIRSHIAIESRLTPVQIRNKGKLVLEMFNRGNAPTMLAAKVGEEHNPLFFEFDRKPIRIRPGEARSIEIQVKPFRRPIMAQAKSAPFPVAVKNAESDEVYQDHLVQASITPYLPLWTLSIFGFCLMLLMVGYALFGDSIWPADADVEVQNSGAGVASGSASNSSSSAGAISSGYESNVPPDSCLALKRQRPDATDGDYELFLTNNPDYPLAVYCHNMETRPAEYVTLRNGETAGNFTTVMLESGPLSTRFDKVRIDTNTLIIDRTDLTFTQVEQGVPNDDEIIRDFGTAMGCDQISAVSQIDLTGTPLALNATLDFSIFGPDSVGNSTISEDRKQATLQANGNCGWIWPDGDMQLAYVVEQIASE